jgi:predicted restriction endonuclease
MRFPKPESRTVERRRETRRQRRLTAAVREAVVKRDPRCRVCGIVFCGAVRAELHHLRFRSQGGATSTQNTLLVCSACHHGQIHGRLVTLVPVDAERGADGVVEVQK